MILGLVQREVSQFGFFWQINKYKSCCIVALFLTLGFDTDKSYYIYIMIHLVCNVLVNSNNLTANYGAKQNQFTKPTSEPRASDLKNLMRLLTA